MATKMEKKKVLQAVVLADDFTTNLNPMQNIFPSVLMPVININLLDYLLETLIRSGIQELFLYCSNHVDLLKAYIKEKNCTKIVISLIISDGCRSLGDALRDIDTKGWIRGYFILIRGDAFINADLKSALDAHYTKAQKDKGATMTMVLRNIGSTKDFFLKEEPSLVVSDKTNKKILHYSKLKKHEKKIKLELNWFLDHSEIELSTCFLDTHVYLCSPSVLPLFADNFDFQTMEDFIRGVLMNEEILDSRIYWQELNHEDYSLPISSWEAYHILNRDILHRHSFPLAPDAFPSLKNFVYMSQSTYKHRSAILAKGCILEKDCILGKNSVLGSDTRIMGSVIGDNCIIGSKVTIENTYIVSNVNIGDNCIITNSIVFQDCVIKEGVQMNGRILSPGSSVNNQNLKGTGIFASEMTDKDSSDESSRTDVSSSDGNSERNSPIPDDTNMFLSEVIDSLLRGYQDKLNCENLILEINSSRYAYNVTIREVTYNVIKAILSLPLHYLSEAKEAINHRNYQRNLKIMITYFHPIILNYVKTEDAQNDCLHAMEEVAGTTSELLPFLQHLLHIFYERDILSEDKILEWYESEERDVNDTHSEKVRTAVQPFIKWLEEAEEDSTDSEDG